MVQLASLLGLEPGRENAQEPLSLFVKSRHSVPHVTRQTGAGARYPCILSCYPRLVHVGLPPLANDAVLYMPKSKLYLAVGPDEVHPVTPYPRRRLAIKTIRQYVTHEFPDSTPSANACLEKDRPYAVKCTPRRRPPVQDTGAKK